MVEPQPGKAIVDCLAADAAQIGALVAGLGTKTNPDGTRDWAAIAADAIARGVVIGGCALAEFVESYLAPTRAMVASNAPADGLLARQTLERFRATRNRSGRSDVQNAARLAVIPRGL